MSQGKVYILSMERYGDREGHHYNCGLYSDLAEATIEALAHENLRAGKYEFRIELSQIDGDSVQEVPREVCINYAKLRFPEKFDDKSRLKEDE